MLLLVEKGEGVTEEKKIVKTIFSGNNIGQTSIFWIDLEILLQTWYFADFMVGVLFSYAAWNGSENMKSRFKN